MAKSLRSKVKRRWRSLRRKVMDEVFVKPNCEKMNDNIKATVNGFEYRQEKKKNAFLHPEDPSAEFPQNVPAKIIDMRSAYIPFGGSEWVGARRKQVKDVQILVDNLHGEQTEYEQNQINDLEAMIEGQAWAGDNDDDEEDMNGAKPVSSTNDKSSAFEEEKVSRRSLLKQIAKDKKVVKKPQRKSRKLLKF